MAYCCLAFRRLCADVPPLANQLTELGRQALDQGANGAAETFSRKPWLDPANADAAIALKKLDGPGDQVVRVALQDPAPPPTPEEPGTPAALSPPVPAVPASPRATLEESLAAENIARQQLTNDVEQRIQNARALLNQGLPEAALNALRLTQNVVRSATNVGEPDRAKLDRRIQAQMMATVQAEERIVQRASGDGSGSTPPPNSEPATIDMLQRDKQTIEAMMIQFDT